MVGGGGSRRGGGGEKFVIDTYGENVLTAAYQPFVLPLHKTGDYMIATGRCFAQRKYKNFFCISVVLRIFVKISTIVTMLCTC